MLFFSEIIKMWITSYAPGWQFQFMVSAYVWPVNWVFIFHRVRIFLLLLLKKCRFSDCFTASCTVDCTEFLLSTLPHCLFFCHCCLLQNVVSRVIISGRMWIYCNLSQKALQLFYTLPFVRVFNSLLHN